MRFWCALILFAAGCFGQGGATGGGGGQVGYTSPTLEVTINGVHLGPAALDPGSSGSLIDTKDQFGFVSDSQLQLVAASSIGGATCQLSFERYGEQIAGIGAAGYTLATPSGSGTADGTAMPIGGERVIGPGDSWQCAGSSCDGSSLVINAIDSLHVEGYYSATLASDSGGQPAEVVCAFYVPITSYAP